MDTASTGPAQRERAKAERRGRIIDAARALIRESGEAGASMRAIADRADVSLATPYNLFGSKRAIVQALLGDINAFQTDFQDTADLSAVDRIFTALDMILRYFEKDPDFYRVVCATLLDTTGPSELKAELVPPSNSAFWEQLIEDAMAEGSLAREITSGRLNAELQKCFSANMLAWIQGLIADGDLARATAFGYALILSGAATDQGRASLRKYLFTR